MNVLHPPFICGLSLIGKTAVSKTAGSGFDSQEVMPILRGRHARGVDVMSRGFDSPGVRVRLLGAPGGKKVRSGKSDGVGSPERSPSSLDAVIACVVRSQKRGVDSTRGNYVSAVMLDGYRHP